MIKAAVLGYPIAHSLSPKIHNFWLKKHKIDGSYEAIEVKPDDLKDFLNAMPEKGFYGCNLTIPLKEKALEILGNVDPFAKFIGAVNTVIIKDGYFLGTNTDFIGFARNIISYFEDNNLEKPDFSQKTAFILGAGGAARAVLFALLSLKFKNIIITNRTKERAQEICESAKQYFKVPDESFTILDWDKRHEVIKNSDLIVNTTSLGMAGQEELKLDLDGIKNKNVIVTDIVYKPLETTLLKQAKEKGAIAIDGLGMLLHQAAPGFESWFGVKPEVNDDLRREILK